MTLDRLRPRGAAHPSPDHRARLERDLLARFDALHPPPTQETTMPHPMLRRAALLAGLLLAAGGASQAPADYRAEIGKRIEFDGDAPLAPPQLQALVAALQGGAHRFEVRVQVRRRDGGAAVTTIELFGDTAALGDPAAAIRQAVPALAARPIAVAPIERTVQGELGDVAGRLVGLERRLPPAELERAIAAELAEREPGAQVQVKVEGEGDARRVRVEVRQEAGPAAAPARP
jgi:hypothetical protein